MSYQYNKNNNRSGIKTNNATSSTRTLLMLSGTLVALIIFALFTSANYVSPSANIDQPIEKVNELMHFAIPNVVFYFF